jgi:hypothetical protein
LLSAGRFRWPPTVLPPNITDQEPQHDLGQHADLLGKGYACFRSPPDGRIRLIAGLALFALAAITAIVSYLHAVAVVRAVGNTGAVAYLIPFVADLMIVSASMALLEAARNSAAKPALAIVSLVFGIGATLAMNVAAGWHFGSAGVLVAALPPVAWC